MIVQRTMWEIACDEDGCRHGYAYEGGWPEAVSAARSAGWKICVIKGGRQYCPDHRDGKMCRHGQEARSA